MGRGCQASRMDTGPSASPSGRCPSQQTGRVIGWMLGRRRTMYSRDNWMLYVGDRDPVLGGVSQCSTSTDKSPHTVTGIFLHRCLCVSSIYFMYSCTIVNWPACNFIHHLYAPNFNTKFPVPPSEIYCTYTTSPTQHVRPPLGFRRCRSVCMEVYRSCPQFERHRSCFIQAQTFLVAVC